MFKGLKNKIREETGSDVSRIVPILTSTQKTGLVKGRHSRQGSTSSIGSSSLDGLREESTHSPSPANGEISSDVVNTDLKTVSPKELKVIEKKEEEWKRKFNKLELEWKKKFDDNEKEWKRKLENLEKERTALESNVNELRDALAQSEEFKKKYCQFQEEKEQLEGFQTQEMAKIKHLLLVKERELTAKAITLKESNAQLASARSEVNRLRRFEKELSNVQDEMETLRHSSEQERATLRSELANSEESVRHLRDRVAVLERRTSSADSAGFGGTVTADERVQGLLGERTLLERRLEEAHLHLADIKSSWSSKIASLETQVGRLCRQAGEEGAERRRAEAECTRLEEVVTKLEEELSAAAEKNHQHDLLTQQNEQLQIELDSAVQAKEDLSGQLAASETNSSSEIKKMLEELDLKESELIELKSKSEESVNSLKLELSQLEEKNKIETGDLKRQLSQSIQEAEKEKKRCAELNSTLDRERVEKDATLLRNAEVSQQVELSNQRLRSKEGELADSLSRIDFLENSVAVKEQELQKIKREHEETSARLAELKKEFQLQCAAVTKDKELQNTLLELQAEVLDKNKVIRQLQQRLGDMKKTLQRELKLPSGGQSLESVGQGNHTSSDDGIAAVLAPSSSHQLSQKRLQQQAGVTTNTDDYNDINFQYRKHVLIKFLTSREYEALHLLRAVATLLHFSPEEERLLRETLEWRMSWFGSKPRARIGMGSSAKKNSS